MTTAIGETLFIAFGTLFVLFAGIHLARDGNRLLYLLMFTVLAAVMCVICMSISDADYQNPYREITSTLTITIQIPKELP